MSSSRLDLGFPEEDDEPSNEGLYLQQIENMLCTFKSHIVFLQASSKHIIEIQWALHFFVDVLDIKLRLLTLLCHGVLSIKWYCHCLFEKPIRAEDMTSG